MLILFKLYCLNAFANCGWSHDSFIRLDWLWGIFSPLTFCYVHFILYCLNAFANCGWSHDSFIRLDWLWGIFSPLTFCYVHFILYWFWDIYFALILGYFVSTFCYVNFILYRHNALANWNGAAETCRNKTIRWYITAPFFTPTDSLCSPSSLLITVTPLRAWKRVCGEGKGV